MFKMTIKNRLIVAFLAVLIIPCASIGWFAYQKTQSEITTRIMDSANQSIDSMNSQVY